MNFKNEMLTGVNSCNRKLYDYKLKLKHLISKMDKLTLTNYTVLEDSKTSEENLIFSNKLKDIGDYLIMIGQQFIDKATAIEIVASSSHQSETDKLVSEEDDVIYVSTEQLISDTKIEDDKKKYNRNLFPLKRKNQLVPHLHHQKMKEKLQTLKPMHVISLNSSINTCTEKMEIMYAANATWTSRQKWNSGIILHHILI